jgi:DNA-3-methyladenine glycosylase
MPPLPQSFFARPVDELARALLGCRIKRGRIVLAITEVEAYAGPEDTASHARFGETERNAAMWGPAGRAYVYLCYGLHNMLNISAAQPGRASAVLIRACEPVAGLDEIHRRRGLKSGAALLAGPGKVGAALELDTSWSGHPLYRAGGLSVLPGERPVGVLAGPRVGIEFAEQADRDRPWRFAAADSAWVSHPLGLRPA